MDEGDTDLSAFVQRLADFRPAATYMEVEQAKLGKK